MRKPSKIALVIIILFFLFISLAACSGEESLTVVKPKDNLANQNLIDNIEIEQVPGKKIIPGEYLRFDHYSVENGLSQSTVFAMLQDSRGFMWFGTEDGLNKF